MVSLLIECCDIECWSLRVQEHSCVESLELGKPPQSGKWPSTVNTEGTWAGEEVWHEPKQLIPHLLPPAFVAKK